MSATLLIYHPASIFAPLPGLIFVFSGHGVTGGTYPVGCDAL